MPGAQALRLIEALTEFIGSYTGDTGNPGGRAGGDPGAVRGAIDAGAASLVHDATALKTKLTGAYGGGDPSARNTPGSRATARASTGGAGTAGARARAMMGGGQ